MLWAFFEKKKGGRLIHKKGGPQPPPYNNEEGRLEGLRAWERGPLYSLSLFPSTFHIFRHVEQIPLSLFFYQEDQSTSNLGRKERIPLFSPKGSLMLLVFLKKKKGGG